METKTRTLILYATIANFSGLVITLALEIVHRSIYHESRYLLGVALFGAATLISAAWLAYKQIGE